MINSLMRDLSWITVIMGKILVGVAEMVREWKILKELVSSLELLD